MCVWPEFAGRPEPEVGPGKAWKSNREMQKQTQRKWLEGKYSFGEFYRVFSFNA